MMTGANSPTDQAEVAAFLAGPATHGGFGVERIDTHGSMVFMAGDRVYKLKRVVRFCVFESRRRSRPVEFAQLPLDPRDRSRRIAKAADCRHRVRRAIVRS